MERINTGVLGALQIIEIVSLNCLVQERQPEGQNQQDDNTTLSGKAPPGDQARKIGSTALAWANRSCRSSSDNGR